MPFPDAVSESAQYPASWAGLSYPWQRRELLLYLDELSAPDPRPIWVRGAREGLITGVDQVIHFIFDDHDFDEGCIGVSLLNAQEVATLAALKAALNALITLLPGGGDDHFVGHPLWPNVTRSAIAAAEMLNRAS